MKSIVLTLVLVIAITTSFIWFGTQLVQAKPQNSSERKVANSSKKHTNFNQIVTDDVRRFQKFYTDKFTNVPFAEFSNGVYAIDSASREQWLEMEEFPPYELAVDEGKELFETDFSNGKNYSDCFARFSQGIRQQYPYFDNKTKQVVTLELAINQCRTTHGEMPLAYGSEEITAISGYLAFLSRGNKFDLKVNSVEAYNAYLAGKQFYYSKRGQLNFACSDCHIKITGTKLRADTVSPGLGHPTGMPVYRSKWGELGSIGRRYQECNKNVRAAPFELQSDVYRNLEFFQTIMSNGLEVNGPSSRK